MATKSPTQPTLAQLKAENAKLKAENVRLAEQVSTKRGHRASPKQFMRQLAVGILLFLTVVLISLGNIVFWTGNTLVKQDRFVAATSPIIKDTEVQKSLALYTTNQIFANVDVEQLTGDALPPKAQFLAPQLTEQLQSQTNNLLYKAVSSPRFVARWNKTSANWHDRIITYATDYEGNGEISLNDIYTQVSDELRDTKLSFLANKQLPAKVGDITVINATWLPTLHRVITKIDTWRLLTVLLLVVSLTGAVLLSRARRRTLYLFSFGTTVMMIATLIALNVAKESLASRVDAQYASGVRDAFQILTHSLVTQTFTIMSAALLVAFVSWISGQSKSALSVKNQGVYVLTGRIHESLLGQSTSGIVSWTQAHKRQLEWSVVAVLTAIMLLVHLTLKSLLFYGGLMLVLILVIETVGSTSNKNPRPRK